MESWEFNESKFLALLQREYGITETDALLNYTNDQLQLRLACLPADRIVPPNQNLNKVEYENRYLEAFCDRKTKVNSSVVDGLILKRAELRAREIKEGLDFSDQIEELTQQIRLFDKTKQ